MAFSLFLCPNKDSNKDNKLLRPLNLSDTVQRCEAVGGPTFALLCSLHPNPPLLQVSSILSCTPKLHGLSFQLFPQNVNHFSALSCSIGLSLQPDTIWPRLVLVTVTETQPLWELQQLPLSKFCDFTGSCPSISACPLCPQTGLHDLSACLILQQISDYLLLITNRPWTTLWRVLVGKCVSVKFRINSAVCKKIIHIYLSIDQSNYLSIYLKNAVENHPY